jgi:putative SOS response-associated peptidase YedK
MPVVLDRADYATWLDPALQDQARLTALLVPAPSDGLELVRVSRAVNSPANDRPECIEPLVE